MPLSRLLFDDTIELHLDMERVAIESRATIVKLLQDLEKELIAKVTDGVTDWSKARIAKQLSEADAIIRQYYDDAAGIARDTTTSVAQVSASATATSLSAAVGGQVAIGVIPTASYLETLASNVIVQGAVQRDWWERQAGDTAFKFQSAVRQGLVGAETTPQIVRRVRDVMDISKRNAETLVHTSVQSVANTTREKIFDDNGDVMSGKEWSSALDRRTCPTCGALDGKRWTTDGKKINHSMVYQIPPKHFRCRCSMVPVLKTWKELGINMDELPDGTRASMEGQVVEKDFESWLRRKDSIQSGFADRTLGKGRAELWRNGKITMDQMISGGQPLSLGELRSKYSGKVAAMDTIDKKAFSDWTKQVTQKDYKARHEFKQVGVIPDYVLNDKDVSKFKLKNNNIDVSDYLLRHGQRPKKSDRNATLSIEHLKNLPNLIDESRWIYDNYHNNIISFFDIGDQKRTGKAVVMFNYDRMGDIHNAVITTGVVDKADMKSKFYRELNPSKP